LSASNDADTKVFKMLYRGDVSQANRRAEQLRKGGIFNQKHGFYKRTRCTSAAQEAQSALPAGVINVCEDTEDEEEYGGEEKEIAKEMQELRASQKWVNQPGWDAVSEGQAECPVTGNVVNLRLDWAEVERKMNRDLDGAVGKATAEKEDEVLRRYPLELLDPTQRAFANRVLAWGAELVEAYRRSVEAIAATGKPLKLPVLRTWLGGSAGSGKSTTLRTIVQHLRLMFAKANIGATVELTAYTGVAAFNIGLGAKTCCSSFQVFPGAVWQHELQGEAFRRLEQQWKDVVLLIVDEISFVGKAFFAKMHHRLQQGKRRFFSEAGLDPSDFLFGNVSMILVGDFGQLEPIDDWSMCDNEGKGQDCPARLRHLWRFQKQGQCLLREFLVATGETKPEAILLQNIHRSGDDMAWTESCLRLRDFECTEEDFRWWRSHDLDRGNLSESEKTYFDCHAVWLCARCEDVGARNGRKLAHMAEDEKRLIHQIHAQHSNKTAKRQPSSVFDGLRPVINLVRGCKVMLTRNVAYEFGLANGTRGTLIGVVYGPGGVGTFPEAVVAEFTEYCGPEFYPGQPKWVPILPKFSRKDGTRMTRIQFPIVAGFALTVNKAQGLTIKEGVVIHLVGSKRFRPASKHGLAFVAWTRSESFRMTAFKNLPAWGDFMKGKESDMLRMRKRFVERLQALHQNTLAANSDMKTAEQENAAYLRWKAEQEHDSKRARTA